MLGGEGGIEVSKLDKATALDHFLAAVERRAFRMAVIATGHDEDAMDIVQDAMLKLVSRYADKDETEWGPLFHRIMVSTLNDWFRRRKVRRRWQGILSVIGYQADEHEGGRDLPDPIQQAPERDSAMPSEVLAREQSMLGLETALHALPLRQQQAFLLRVWEGLDVASTATAMGCSQGSVKTHYSRAVHSLRNELEAYL